MSAYSTVDSNILPNPKNGLSSPYTRRWRGQQPSGLLLWLWRRRLELMLLLFIIIIIIIVMIGHDSGLFVSFIRQ